ncbi:MAG: LysM domain-containing protein [Acidimicrobiales bacterium]
MANTCSFEYEDSISARSGVVAAPRHRFDWDRTAPWAVHLDGAVSSPAIAVRPGSVVGLPEGSRRTELMRPQRAGCANEVPGSTRAERRRVRVLLGAVAVALVVALALPWGGAGGHPLATPGSVRAGDPLSSHDLYVVQAGDTLWTIAQRLAPGSDPRPVATQLAAQVGGDTIVPGERLVLP